MRPYCQAMLNYSNGHGYHPVEVTIGDGRAALGTLDYERCGFTLLENHSEVTDWRDQAHLQEVHVGEIEALARDCTGADHAIAYAPLVRSPAAARQHSDYAPIEFVHSDYTDDYRAMVQSPERPYMTVLTPLLERSGLSHRDVARAKRILVLQFWRNTGAELPDYPIAFCDAETVPRSQLYAFKVPEYGGLRLEFETFGVRAPADPNDHHWYTFPGLSIDEVVAFRTFDSQCAEENRPFWTPHSAFRDPHAGETAPRRESLEMRVLCLFGVS